MKGWTLTEAAGALTLHRAGRAPAWHVAVERVLPGPGAPAGDRRIAHQVRQDVWRAVRGVPGFVPAVRVERTAAGLAVRAGGDLLTRAGHRASIAGRVADVLDRPANRRRWLAHAARRAA